MSWSPDRSISMYSHTNETTLVSKRNQKKEPFKIERSKKTWPATSGCWRLTNQQNWTVFWIMNHLDLITWQHACSNSILAAKPELHMSWCIFEVDDYSSVLLQHGSRFLFGCSSKPLLGHLSAMSTICPSSKSGSITNLTRRLSPSSRDSWPILMRPSDQNHKLNWH